MSEADRMRALEKLAQWSPTVGVSNPQPTVSDVLNAIGLAQVHGIGTPKERTDAFGRIINSGLVASHPAEAALKMIGGGILGRMVTGAVTDNPLIKGIGTGFGAGKAMNW